MTDLMNFLHDAQKCGCLTADGVPDDGGFNFMVKAAKEGNLLALVYGHLSHFKTLPMVCQMAARSGSLPCLIFLHRIANAPWDQGTIRQAARSGSLACLEYAHQNGLELDAQTRKLSMQACPQCRQYVLEHAAIESES